ncbi:MAG: peptide-methionine (S)-S-oxide reductase MsrA, partial [Propionibacteriaceae bacterium]|nr:peptide-methionine (S)-S-oxide reductase MsrA [Propionibacteriaceae bacterium]
SALALRLVWSAIVAGMTEKIIHLAGGCFWGVEKYVGLIPGVGRTRVGYANGSTERPTYEAVCSQTTGHAETVEVAYDPEQLSLDNLLFLFYEIIDPTSLNRQGNDHGTQYRTGVYWSDPLDQATVLASLDELSRRVAAPVAVEALPLASFWPAEDYHQDYLAHHSDGYCHIPAAGFAAVAARAGRADRLRALSPEQYAVTQLDATEPPFTNEYCDLFEPGVYVDVVTGEPLFTSADKFDSECGWPAFACPIDDSALVQRPDHTLARPRTEVRAQGSGSHLGHVFADGPADLGGLRYCVNSAALRFVPLADMAAQGYASLIPAVTAPTSRDH